MKKQVLDYPPVKYSVGVIAFREYSGKYEVLLVEHTSKSKIAPGKIGFPAGKIEYFETISMGGRREFEEESGATLNPNTLEQLCVLNGMIKIDGKMTPTIYNVLLSMSHTEELRAEDNGKVIPGWYKIRHVPYLDHIAPDIPTLIYAGLDKYKYILRNSNR